MSTCHRDHDAYWLKTHRDDCRDNRCAGCVPCAHDDHGNPVRHCEIRRSCTSHLGWAEHACPRCLGRIRTDLADLLDVMALMPAEAEHAGIDSAAMVLAGPVANPVRHRWRLVNAVRAGESLKLIEEPDERDPYTALATRERVIREELGHDTETLCSDTLAACVGYLTWVLPDLTGEDRLPLLLDLADAARHARAYAEAVEHDSRTPERGAPCPRCKKPKPRLVRRWAHWCDDADCEREHDTTGARDTWQCPREADHWWSEADYRLRVSDDYLTNADRLTAEQMADRVGVPVGKIRSWAATPKVWVNGELVDGTPRLKAVGRDERGRKLYPVDAAKELASRKQAVG